LLSVILVTYLKSIKIRNYSKLLNKLFPRQFTTTINSFYLCLFLCLQVDLSGKPLGNLGFLEVIFQWPYALTNQKWLLYLSEIQMTGTSKPFCVPEKNLVNPLNLSVSD